VAASPVLGIFVQGLTSLRYQNTSSTWRGAIEDVRMRAYHCLGCFAVTRKARRVYGRSRGLIWFKFPQLSSAGKWWRRALVAVQRVDGCGRPIPLEVGLNVAGDPTPLDVIASGCWSAQRVQISAVSPSVDFVCHKCQLQGQGMPESGGSRSGMTHPRHPAS
jgi:hypothetical protein